LPHTHASAHTSPFDRGGTHEQYSPWTKALCHKTQVPQAMQHVSLIYRRLHISEDPRHLQDADSTCAHGAAQYTMRRGRGLAVSKEVLCRSTCPGHQLASGWRTSTSLLELKRMDSLNQEAAKPPGRPRPIKITLATVTVSAAVSHDNCLLPHQYSQRLTYLLTCLMQCFGYPVIAAETYISFSAACCLPHV
jgi:hypothetical protein